MRQHHATIQVATPGQGLVEVTDAVAAAVAESGIRTGLVTVFIQHTSASLLIQENADPDVQTDLQAFFRRLVPDGDPLFVHASEGPDDMPAHVKAALTQTSLSIPVLIGGRMALGTWQGIYVFEHRARPHRRTLLVHVIGE
jgi:secondary thiamine-phosphate synthase enzyme